MSTNIFLADLSFSETKFLMSATLGILSHLHFLEEPSPAEFSRLSEPLGSRPNTKDIWKKGLANWKCQMMISDFKELFIGFRWKALCLSFSGMWFDMSSKNNQLVTGLAEGSIVLPVNHCPLSVLPSPLFWFQWCFMPHLQPRSIWPGPFIPNTLTVSYSTQQPPPTHRHTHTQMYTPHICAYTQACTHMCAYHTRTSTHACMHTYHPHAQSMHTQNTHTCTRSTTI